MSALFNNYRNLLGGKSTATGTLPNLDTGDIRLSLIAQGYTPALTLNTYSQLTAGNIEHESPALTCEFGGAAGTGVFDHDDITLIDVGGDVVDKIVYRAYNADAAQSVLICLVDTFASGMPFTPSDGPVDIQPSNSGVFGI